MSTEVTSRNVGANVGGGSSVGGAGGIAGGSSGVASGSINTVSGGNIGTGASSNQNHHNNVQMSKADEIEIQVLDHNPDQPEIKRASLGWICCAPCIWIRTSTTVHKIALSAATLLVTSLLVASPILFLISTAPSQLPKDCYVQEDDDCAPTPTPSPDCTEPECRIAASSIQGRMNWNVDPCKSFKSYSCSPLQNSNFRVVKSAQEISYMQLQQLLIHNTTTGTFRKLGRLYGSCLRQKFNSSTIRLFLDELGGYYPVGTLGPSSVSALVSKLNSLGPMPLVELYYDLSYGKSPQNMLIIDGPSFSPYVLENPIRWMGPKAPHYVIKDEIPNMLDTLLHEFLPHGLGMAQKNAEKAIIRNFIIDFNQIRKYHLQRDFTHSVVFNNVSSLHSSFSFLNWSDLISSSWSGPIVVRSVDYFNKLRILLSQYQTRVIHNSLLVLFALNTLPPSNPSPDVCTRATMWALPEVTSALYIAQFSEEQMANAIDRTEKIFTSLKAHLKRAPTLRSQALVKLSQLKVQAHPWPTLLNLANVTETLDKLEIASDNWFENIIKIYKIRKSKVEFTGIAEVQTAWSYPPIAKPFYDNLSHSVVVPLSLILVPYFDVNLPIYAHYATVGVALGREIFRSVTKSFDDKPMRCVPSAIDVFSNSSREEILIYSGGMQMAYHSLLIQSGPVKGMERLPGLSMSSTQIFFLLVAQEFCIESEYDGVDTASPDFEEVLAWLIAQGGSASDVFSCPSGSLLKTQKTCNVL